MTSRNSARIAGIAFLVYIAASLTGLALFNRATRGTTMAEKLATVATNLTDVRLATIMVVLSALSALVLAATLYGLTRESDREFAAFGLVCRGGEGILGIFQMTELGMIWLATGKHQVDADTAQGIAAFLLAAGDWKANASALLFALGSTAFAIAFLRGRLIHMGLARFGVAVSVLLVVSLPLSTAGWIGGTVAYLVMWMPMLVFELWLAGYLITKGTANHRIRRESAYIAR